MHPPAAPVSPEASVRALLTAFEARDWAAAETLLAEDFVAEWPQTRERFSGRERYMAMNRAYPGDWHVTILRVVGAGGLAVSEVRFDLGGSVEYGVSIWRVEGGRIRAETSWFGEPYEPPAWRAAFADPS